MYFFWSEYGRGEHFECKGCYDIIYRLFGLIKWNNGRLCKAIPNKKYFEFDIAESSCNEDILPIKLPQLKTNEAQPFLAK